MNRQKPDLIQSLLDRRLLIFSFITAFVMLTLCSKSSFLYPFNDWVDANCYFTVGKGMLQGKVVYRDLFEQKGVLLYFLHALAYLVSHTTFIGVFFIEVIAGTAYLYYAAKTVTLFVDERWACVILPVLAALVYSSKYFAHGDSAEELCLPLLMAGFYHLLRFFRDSETLTLRTVAVCGALAGCVLWIKYTMLGFWLGFIVAIFVALLLKRQAKKAFAACACFLAGMIAAAIPWAVYFAANGASEDWFHAYFTLNITAYAKTSGFAAVMQSAWGGFYTNVSKDPALLVSMLLGLLGFIGTRRLISGAWAKISFVLLPVLLVLGVYGGGRNYPYYFLIVTGMTMLPGLIAAASLFSGIGGFFRRSAIKRKEIRAARISPLLAFGCAVVLIASAIYAYSAYQYKDFMKVDKDELAQTQFAAVMHEEENPTLLNFGFLDGGFYTAADILPGIRYFCNLNVNVPGMLAAQIEAIRNKTVQFVVLRSDSTGQGRQSIYTLLEGSYQRVAEVKQEFEHRLFTYSLYKLTD